MGRAAPKCRGCGRELKRDTLEEFEGLCGTISFLLEFPPGRSCRERFMNFVGLKVLRTPPGDVHTMIGVLPLRAYHPRPEIYGFPPRSVVGIDFSEPTAQVLLDEWLEQRLATPG